MGNRGVCVLIFLLCGSVIGLGQHHGGTVVVSDESPANSLDPHRDQFTASMYVAQNIYESLVTTDEFLNIQPKLATSWERSEDGLTMTFHLRQQVQFHHGREMTADDVVFSLNRARSTESPHAAQLAPVDEVTAIDRYTVRIVLSEPYTPILAVLSDVWRAIVPRDAVESGVDLREAPVGTGPYVFEEWREDGTIVLLRNTAYWDAPLPYLDQVIFRPILETDERVAAFLDGTIDFALGAPTAAISVLEQIEGIDVFNPIAVAFSMLGINHKISPFSDLRVRQAMAYAIDRQAIVDLVHDGRGSALTCGAFADDLWYGCGDETIPARGNVQRARELMIEAGYADGFETTLLFPEGYERMNAEFRLFIGFLAEIDIVVREIVKPIGDVLDAWSAMDFELYVYATQNQADPHSVVFSNWHSDGAQNIGQYVNETVDEMIEEAGREPNRDRRAAAYREISRILTEDVAGVFMAQTSWYGVYRSSRVRNFIQFPIGGFDVLRSVWVEEGL